jgi:hypothetical protein
LSGQMTRSRRTLFLLLASAGLVVGAAAMLVFTVPSFKHAVKERWHRWSCPDLPALRSERMVATDGRVLVRDPFSNDTVFHAVGPDLLFGFDPTVVFPTITTTLPARGRYLLQGTSGAIVRRIGDVSNGLVSVSAGFMMTCADPAPDVRIVMRIDHADGTLVEWNEKRLIAGEHRPNEQERFNFEWILRDLSISPDDLVAVFLIGNSNEELWIDDLSIVFRSSSPPRPTMPHA